MKTLIQNVQVVNEGNIFRADVCIENEKISAIEKPHTVDSQWASEVIDGTEL
ncbi:MAG: dihydroorotase, partial [Bacteroidetes bacterium]|nr:dihydroorotase [Bacteroidota bacterium]